MRRLPRLLPALALLLLPLAAPAAVTNTWIGAFADDSRDGGVSQAEVDRYQAITKKGMKVMMFYGNFGTGQAGQGWNQAPFDIADAEGMIPFWKVSPRGSGVDASRVYLDIKNGVYDAYLDYVGDKLAAYGKVVYFDFAHEMNANWKDYHVASSGANGPANFKAAWQRVFNRLKARYQARGYTDFFNRCRFSFAPSSLYAPDPATSGNAWNHVSNYYPGNAYVYVVGCSAYSRASSPKSLNTLLNPIHGHLMTVSNNARNFIISEGAAEHGAGQNQGSWITNNLTATIMANKSIAIQTWFNGGDTVDYRIDLAANKTAMGDAMSPSWWIGGGNF